MGEKSYWELVEEVGKGLCPTFHEDGSCGAAPQQFGCTLKPPPGSFFLWWELGTGFRMCLCEINTCRNHRSSFKIWVNSGNNFTPWSSSVETTPKLCQACFGFELFGCFHFVFGCFHFGFYDLNKPLCSQNTRDESGEGTFKA